MALLHTLSRTPRQTTSWAGRLTDANLHLADLILIDTPIPQDDREQTESIPLDELPTAAVSAGRKGSRLHRSLPTAAHILGDPMYHEVTEITAGRRLNGRHTVHFGRVDGSPTKHPPDSDLAHEIRSRTLADQFTFWGRHLLVTGFSPSNTVEQTLKDVHYTVGRIGIDVDSRDNHIPYSNSLLVDEEWVRENYVSNHWAVIRNNRDGQPGANLVRLEKPALFGTFLMTTAFDGTIAPLSYLVKSIQGPKTYLFTAIPAHVPMEAIQLADRYPPTLAVRSLPFAKDRQALTYGAFDTLHIVLTRVIPEQFVIIPVLQHQQIAVRSKKRRQYLPFIHPDLDEESRALAADSQTFAKDCIWEVILVLPERVESGIPLEDRVRECQKAVFTELATARKGHHALTPPHSSQTPEDSNSNTCTLQSHS